MVEIEVGGFEVEGLVLSTHWQSLFRGRRNHDGMPVLLKAFPHEFPSEADLARLRLDYHTATRLDLECVLKPYSLEDGRSGPVLVQEYFPGIPLSAYGQGFDPDRFFPMAISLARGLFLLHRRGLVHNGLNPHAILLEPGTGKVKFTDLGSSLDLDAEPARIPEILHLDGENLAYMSPERTGRVNYAPDHRSDLYSLGVILHEFITGKTPFGGSDPLSIVHGHMARVPASLHDSDSQVQPCLSSVIAKLLAKNPGDRYQSAFGVMQDLEECRTRIRDSGPGTEFIPGRFDFSDRLSPPTRLLDRDGEMEILEREYDEVARGSNRICLLKGVSGSGKTALVREFRKRILQRGGNFVIGKFDPLRREHPYEAFLQALRALASQAVQGDSNARAGYKARLADGLGDNAQVLVDLIPELELLMGKQMNAQDVGMAESRNRFNLLLDRFIRVFATESRPLVIALDDLQWASPDAIGLIEGLSVSESRGYLLVLGTYRHNEAGKQVEGILEKIRRLEESQTGIQLEPLSREGLRELVEDVFPIRRSDPGALGALLHERTGGNPLFAMELLRQLHDEGMISFDYGIPEGEGEPKWGWAWTLGRIRNWGSGDGLDGLVSTRVRKMSAGAAEALMLASCLGTRVDPQCLAAVGATEADAISGFLQEAVALDLVIRVNPFGSPLPDSDFDRKRSGDETAPAGWAFEFAHDRVQQVVYSMLPDGTRQHNHYLIGTWLRERFRKGGTQEDLFSAAHHLMEARNYFQSSEDRYSLAELNLSAGSRSKTAAAFDQGLAYLRRALEALPENCWRDHGKLAFTIHTELGESEALSGNLGEANRLFDLALRHSDGDFQKAMVYCTKMKLWMHKGRDKEGIDLGVEALSLLKHKVTAVPSLPLLLFEAFNLKRRLAGKRPDSLLNLPDRMADADKAAMDVLMNIWGTAHWINQNLEGLVILRMVSLSLSKGNSEVSPVAYACYGAITAIVFRNFASGLRFGELAMTLAERGGLPRIRCRVLFVYATFLGTLGRPNRENIALYREAFRLSLEAGDLLYAGACGDALISTLPLSAANTGTVRSEIARLRSFAAKADAKRSLTVLQIVERWLDGLEKEAPAAFGEQASRRFAIDIFQESAGNFEIEKGVFYLFETQAACLYGRFEDAWKMAERLAASPIGKGHPVIVAHCYFLPAIASLNHRGCGKRERKRRVAAARKWLRKLSAIYPANFSHLQLLLEAEVAKAEGRLAKAELLYDAAVAKADAGGYSLMAAWAEELAGLSEALRGRQRSSRAYLTGACHRYLLWGAYSKAAQVAERHRLPQGHARPGRADAAMYPPAENGPAKFDALDLMTVIKASHAISGELVLSKLLTRLIRIILECAGAQKCFLIFERKGRLVIEGEGSAGAEDVRVLQSIPLDECPRLSHGVVYRVADEEKGLLIGDISADPAFKDDVYVREQVPKSVLCIPLVHQSKSKGILYLENNLITDAFSPARLGVLNLISTQAAISLETANYHALQMEALQSKISPHFLFNALSSISELIIKDPAKAEPAITKLAGLYRYILASSSDSAVPLAKELDIVRSYLELEKLRFGSRLDFSVQVDDDGCYGLMIPCLALQPLVENSIQHGISPKMGPGKVTVSASIQQNRCRIAISDDGVGLENQSARRPGLGIGLKNVQERLGIFFGEEYSMSINARDGMTIEINLPISRNGRPQNT